MRKYCLLSQLLHLYVSVYMTILRLPTGTEYISVAMCKVKYICIYNVKNSIVLW